MKRILGNLLWGVSWGLAFATILSVFVAMIALLRGSTYFDTYEVSLFHVVAMYFGAALLAGSVAGLLRPLTRSRAGVAIVGAVVGPFVYGAIGYAMGDRGADLIFLALVAGVPVGAACGYAFSKPERAPADERGTFTEAAPPNNAENDGRITDR